MINISERLKCVASFVLDDNKSKRIIDVGCDHALLDIYLLQNNFELNIVASDVNQGPLDKAKENITKYSLLNKIELRLSDGIVSLNDDIDTVVISGMGKDTIVEILNDGKEKLLMVDKLVISSNNKFPDLRKDILKLGFIIDDEKIIYEDGKFYIIMKFIKGKNKYSIKELYFGPCLLKSKDLLFEKYFNYLKEEKTKILSNLPDRCDKKKKELEKELKMLTNELS